MMYNFLNVDDFSDYLDRSVAQGYGRMYVLDLLADGLDAPDHDQAEDLLRNDPDYDKWDDFLEEEDVPL